MSYTLDTNIVIHAFDPVECAKKSIAARLLNQALTTHGMMARQVLGELLAVAHRKPHVSLTSARATIN